jgi:hypothetical protein
MRAHKFSLVWFGEDIGALSTLRSTYIGSEKTGMPDRPDFPASVCRVVEKLQAVDGKRSRVLAKYFMDMRLALSEMFRVLEPGRCCIVVVGPSTMRGQTIKTHELLGDVGNDIGFQTVDIAERKLDRDRRMLPVAFRRNHNSQIESRMHEEYIVGLFKPLR